MLRPGEAGDNQPLHLQGGGWDGGMHLSACVKPWRKAPEAPTYSHSWD